MRAAGHLRKRPAIPLDIRPRFLCLRGPRHTDRSFGWRGLLKPILEHPQTVVDSIHVAMSLVRRKEHHGLSRGLQPSGHLVCGSGGRAAEKTELAMKLPGVMVNIRGGDPVHFVEAGMIKVVGKN